ncbi:MAG: hypothetical protein ABIP97_07125 [Chthoniobacterales bacterium]
MKRILVLTFLFLTAAVHAQTPSPAATATATATATPASTPAAPPAADFTDKEFPSVKATLAIPKGWFFFELKSTDLGASYLITKEKVESEYDSFKTGMTLNIIRGQNGYKPSEFAKSLIEQSQEKDENSKIETSDEPPYKVYKTTQTIETDEGKLVMLTLFKANDKSGTLYHFTWQYPQKEEAQALPLWNEMLKRIKIDPAF